MAGGQALLPGRTPGVDRRSLERQFNVDITIPDERLRRICFTGEFVDGENIHEIMRIISADSRILCRSRKNHFELYRNR